MNLIDLAQKFNTEAEAREFLERKRWPNGAVCPHCGVEGESYRLMPKAGSKKPVRAGVWKCGGCRKQFTVRVGTIFEDSHIPLHKWTLAIHLMVSSKKGMSAHQFHRMLGIGYQAAWFMCHRIRYAMTQEPLSSKLAKFNGPVEMDETYVGGKKIGQGVYAGKQNKAPVVSLVERHGKVRSFHVANVTAANLKPIIEENINAGARLNTDDAAVYDAAVPEGMRHDVVNHSAREYSRRENGMLITTNTVEGYFSLLKRGVYGTFHHVSKAHLHRYLSEFDFRYNARDIDDGERAVLAIKGTAGKRLMYRDSSKGA
jgi:transposase-like protein